MTFLIKILFDLQKNHIFEITVWGFFNHVLCQKQLVLEVSNKTHEDVLVDCWHN